MGIKGDTRSLDSGSYFPSMEDIHPAISTNTHEAAT